MAKGFTDRELVIYLARQIENALNDEDGEVAELRSRNFDRYYGKPYGDEEDGRSQFVTREVFESVEWAIPSVLRFFTGDGRAVEFEPLDESDEQRAEQETDVVNHIAMHRNDGFMFLYSVIKSLLMYPNGYAKVWIEERKSVEFERFEGVNLIGLQEFEANPDTEIVESTERMELIEVMPDQWAEVPLYDIRVKRTKEDRRLRTAALPPDEVLISDSHDSLDLDEAVFVCHRRRMTISELVEKGYDPDELEGLSADNNKWNSERVNRLFYEEENPDSDDEEDGAQRELWVHECYPKVDVDGDGIAERRYVLLIGDEIFENEEVSYQPIIGSSAIPIPNKHIGMSYVEAVENLQLVATVLTRQMLDNIYAHTDQKHVISEQALLSDNSTMDALLDASSAVVVVQGLPGEVLSPMVQTPITAELLQALDHMKDQTQLRTGVAPQVSLDPAVLRDSTMGAFLGALEHASQRLEVLVRIVAETIMKPLYRKVHYLTRQYMSDPISLKIRGSWLQANPGEWDERDGLVVNVGLGNQNKSAKIAALKEQLANQLQLMATGMVQLPEIFNTLERLTDLTGLGSVARFYIDPESEKFQPPQPPQPDPIQMGQVQALMIDAQARAKRAETEPMIEMQKLRADMERFMRELPIKMAEAQAKAAESQEKVIDIREKRDIAGHEAVAKVRNVNEDTRLKGAQRRKLDEETEHLDEAGRSDGTG